MELKGISADFSSSQYIPTQDDGSVLARMLYVCLEHLLRTRVQDTKSVTTAAAAYQIQWSPQVPEITAGPNERVGLMEQPVNGMQRTWAMNTESPIGTGATESSLCLSGSGPCDSGRQA
eukprot:2748248-Pleurochrysis_carterae.AAC.2